MLEVYAKVYAHLNQINIETLYLFNEKGRSVVRPFSIVCIIYDFLERYIVRYIVNLGFLCNDIVIGVFSSFSIWVHLIVYL